MGVSEDSVREALVATTLGLFPAGLSVLWAVH